MYKLTEIIKLSKRMGMSTFEALYLIWEGLFSRRRAFLDGIIPAQKVFIVHKGSYIYEVFRTYQNATRCLSSEYLVNRDYTITPKNLRR